VVSEKIVKSAKTGHGSCSADHNIRTRQPQWVFVSRLPAQMWKPPCRASSTNLHSPASSAAFLTEDHSPSFTGRFMSAYLTSLFVAGAASTPPGSTIFSPLLCRRSLPTCVLVHDMHHDIFRHVLSEPLHDLSALILLARHYEMSH
jgi:hypothetical protein